MDAYSTHIHPLINCVINTIGPVIEMGTGDFSTPLLHYICKAQDRILYSYDSDEQWISKFYYMRSKKHILQHVTDWDILPYFDLCGVLFVDHAPGKRRVTDIIRAKDIATYVVVHDSEEKGYKYEPAFSLYKYRYDYKIYHPETTILSDLQNPKDIF